ncbi:SDR family NAD(P)-dependent oxidoreductase [Euzebya tangerina]|uniref:SDR family NAD(P)-dependent oxidoreductase n=1 Tax=Euzebya tangerina TaxID=591198 RepID=UPI000E324CCF|nr:SDR family NAD(P)-dependent oxidoreductase [Euzebya tangerina]
MPDPARPGRLEGKVAVITGAASGIGAASARLFAAEGAKVVLSDLPGEALEAEAAGIREAGGTAVAIAADVTSLEQCDALAAGAAEAFGPVDVLYANAGIAGTGTVADCDPAMWDTVIAVMLTGVWYSQRAIVGQMIESGGGSVINQASVGGIVGVPGIFPYAAAKAGVIGMTKQSAVEMGPHGVRFNAIAPGTAPTPLVTAVYEKGAGSGGEFSTIEEGLANATKKYPIGRLGTVEDIANLALFLASDESAWITGAVHVIDGGMSAD